MLHVRPSLARAIAMLLSASALLSLAPVGAALPSCAAAPCDAYVFTDASPTLARSWLHSVWNADGTRLYLGGNEGTGNAQNFIVAARDQEGALLWMRSLGHPANRQDALQGLAITPDGTKVVVTGNTYGPTNGANYDVATFVLDAETGSTLHALYYGAGHGHDIPGTLAVTAQRAYVSVTSLGASGNNDMMLLAYNLASGLQLFANRVDGGLPGDDRAWYAAVKPHPTNPGEDVAIITGYSQGLNGDLTTVAFDGAGSQVWLNRYPISRNDFPRAIVLNPATNAVLVAATLGSGATAPQTWGVFSYNLTTGVITWLRQHDGGVESYNNRPLSIVVGPGGLQVYVAGYVGNATHAMDGAVLALDARNGNVFWSHRFDGGVGDDRLVALAHDGGSTVVAAGSVTMPNGATDLLTLALEKNTGQRFWTDTHGGALSQADAAHAIALASGRLAVAGESFESSPARTDATLLLSSLYAKPVPPTFTAWHAWTSPGTVMLTFETPSTTTAPAFWTIVERSISPDGPFEEVDDFVLGSTFEDSGLSAGATYYYRLAAGGYHENSGPSTVVRVVAQTDGMTLPTPELPTGLLALAGLAVVGIVLHARRR